MDSYERGLLAGLLIGEGSFIVGLHGVRPRLAIAVKLHVRSERFLRETRDLVGIGQVNGPYHHGGRNYVTWQIRRLEDLADLVRLLDEDGFEDRCDWVGWRYQLLRNQLAARITW